MRPPYTNRDGRISLAPVPAPVKSGWSSMLIALVIAAAVAVGVNR